MKFDYRYGAQARLGVICRYDSKMTSKKAFGPFDIDEAIACAMNGNIDHSWPKLTADAASELNAKAEGVGLTPGQLVNKACRRWNGETA